MAVLIVRKAAAPVGGDGSFNMTAGEFAGAIRGYFPGLGFGSINTEPFAGETLNLLISGSGSNGIAFAGDLTAMLAGLTVWVDGVEYPFDGQDWAYDSGEDQTTGAWDVAGPVFANTVTYFVEIK